MGFLSFKSGGSGGKTEQHGASTTSFMSVESFLESSDHNEPLLPCDADWPYVWAIRDGKYLDWKRYMPQDPEQQAETLLRHLQLPAPVIDDKLYIGDAKCIENIPRLVKLGITSVLNMAGTRKGLPSKSTLKAYQKHGIAYKSISSHDQYDYPLLDKHWQEASAFLTENTREKHQKCVVNCIMGKNRSALIVAAYYMTATRTPVLETMRKIRYQRGNQALGNEGFQEQLVAFARRHDLLGPIPGSDESMVRVRAPIRDQDWWTKERKQEEQLVEKDPKQRREQRRSFSAMDLLKPKTRANKQATIAA